MSTAQIVPFQPEHWPQLTALLAQSGLPLDGLAEHSAATLVALDGDTLIGCAALELYGDAALLRSVAVAPARQGEGLGKQLVDAIMNLAQQRDVRTLYLLTETAASYFARRGFVPITRSEVTPAVTASVEFASACPASAQVMRLAPLPQPA